MFQLLLLPSFCLSFVVAMEQPSCTASGVVLTWWEEVGVWYVRYDDSPCDISDTSRDFCEGSGWGDEEATVVCREQGYQFGLGKYVQVEQYYDSGYGHIHCTGSESTLRECDIGNVVQPCNQVAVVTDCFHVPQVYFHSMRNPPHYRVVGMEATGSVEFCVKVGGITDHLSLCLTTHSDNTMYSPAIADYDYRLLSHTMLFEPSDAIVLEQCLQIEIIDDTLAEPWERFSVTMSTNNSAVNVTTPQVDVYISPSDTPDNYCSVGSVTAVSDANNSNLQLVQICSDQRMLHPVCDHNWTLHDAIVVCREIGYQGSTGMPLNGQLESEGPQLSYAIYECSGSESRLQDCRVMPGYPHSCHFALVQCSNGTEMMDSGRPNVYISSSHSISTFSSPNSSNTGGSIDGEKTQGSPGKKTIALIAAVVGVVVVVLLVVCVLLFIILKKKHYKLNRGALTATDPHVSENVAYGVTAKHIYTTQNPAYDVVQRKAAESDNNCQGKSLRGEREDLAVATETDTHGESIQPNPVSMGQPEYVN